MAKPAKKKSKSSKKKPPKGAKIVETYGPVGVWVDHKAVREGVTGRGAQTVPTPTQHAESSPPVDGARVAQTVPTPTLQSGDVNVEPPAANLEITTSEPTVDVTENRGRAAEPGLPGIAGSGVTRTFSTKKDPEQPDAEERIRLSDPSAAEARAQIDISRQRLEQLRETLKGFHGNDAPGNHNTPEVPFSQDELESLRAVVASAMALHEVRVVERPIVDALENFRQIIEKFGEVLEEGGKAGAKAVRAVKGLAVEIGATCLAIKELIDIAMSMLGG